MVKRKDSHVQIFDSMLRLGRAILREIERDKPCEDIHAWVFALVAKITASGLAVQALIRAGCTWDAKLVTRSMLDGMIDIAYILSNPLAKPRLIELLRIEAEFDKYGEVEHCAVMQNKSPRQLARDLPGVRAVIESHDRAREKVKSVEESNKRRRPKKPARWKDIKLSEKLRQSVDTSRIASRIDLSVRRLGNAAAHARPIALEHLTRAGKNGELRFLLRPPPRSPFYGPDTTAAEAAFCLLTAYNVVIDHYNLSERLGKRLQRLLDRQRSLATRSRIT